MKGHRDRKTGLTPAEERFCLEIVKPDVSQAEAYRRAFPKAKKWADKTVWSRASELAKASKVQGRVAELRKRLSDALEVTAKDVIRELGVVAMTPAPVKGSDKVAALDRLMRHFGEYDKDNKQKPDGLSSLLDWISKHGQWVGPDGKRTTVLVPEMRPYDGKE